MNSTSFVVAPGRLHRQGARAGQLFLVDHAERVQRMLSCVMRVAGERQTAPRSSESKGSEILLGMLANDAKQGQQGVRDLGCVFKLFDTLDLRLRKFEWHQLLEQDL